MVKNKFYKNLYQSISFFSVIMIFVFSLLMGFAASLNYDGGNGWILLALAISLIILYFCIGFYWIFQKVEISNDGIEITILKKVIQKVKWDDVDDIIYTSVMRNPAYVIIIEESKKINIDSRKKIKNAILHFGNEKIKEQIRELRYTARY